MSRLYVLIIMVTFASCGAGGERGVQTTRGTPDTGRQARDSSLFSEFSVRNARTALELRSWKRTLDMEELGPPEDTSSYVLGDGADTHKGSMIRDYRYRTIRLQFFGPPGGQDIWLLNIELTGDDWQTARGIKTGDPENKLKTAYPEAENKTSADPNIYRYVKEESFIEFNLRNGRITLIKLGYMIP